MSNKPALGKGLSALIADREPDTIRDARHNASASKDSPAAEKAKAPTTSLPLNKLTPGQFQPRAHFDESRLEELAESIKQNGVIQPILVRPLPGQAGSYQIVAGERRWRASKLAGLTEIPVVVKELNDKAALEVALIENIQRQDLTPIEEAEGYLRLIKEFTYTQEVLSGHLGKSRSHIANMLRLLQLPEEVKAMIHDGALTMSHARALIKAENPLQLAEEIIRTGLNVREAEKFAAGSGKKGGGAKGAVIKPKAKAAKPPSGSATTSIPTSINKDEDIVLMEESLTSQIGLKVRIEDTQEGGLVIVHFANLSELDTIVQKLSQQ
jgi:ParB family chromosome partitioning protein